MTVGAVILAAGFGTRLAPLTDHTPKPLIEVGGQPVATHLVTLLRELDAAMPIVVVVNGRHPEAWSAWASGVTGDVTVASNGVTDVDERHGAVADLARGVDMLPQTDEIVVLAGDNLITEPLQPHHDTMRSSGCPVVLCRDLGDHVPPGRFGEVTTDDTGRIVAFREKPADPRSPLVATCTYLLSGGSARSRLAEYLATGGDADSPGAFIAWLASQEPVTAAPLTGPYFDIGNHEALTTARAAFAAEG